VSGRLLCLVLVLSTDVYVKVLVNGAAQAVLGKHAANGILYEALRSALTHFSGRTAVLSAGVSRETDVLLVLPLVARQLHLFGVDDNHIVAAIGVWSEVHFVLATKQARDFRTKASQTLPFGIDQQPLLVCVLLIDGDCLIAQRVHGGTV